MIEDFDMEQLVEPLLLWFRGNARILPWREEPTPYHVWVSEIMLQQTRVEAVKPYYERFLKRLPDVAALAAAPEGTYLKLWEGLGYYNRVRNLHEAAVQIVERFGGVIPDDYDTLLTLKGIGSYTAGAIVSIAYQKPYPAVDGNVLRVIARVTADDSDIRKQSVRANVEKCLKNLMNSVQFQPGDFNQALMELGATVCLPNGAPHCAECPWKKLCEAKKQDRIAKLPVKQTAKARRIEDLTVFIVRDGERVAIHKRAEKGLLAGLYELPNQPGHLTQEEALSYLKECGYQPIRIQPLADAKHIFSHVEWHMKAYAVLIEEPEETLAEKAAKSKGARSGGEDWIFVEYEDSGQRYAIPAAFSYYTAYMEWRLGRDAFLE